MPLGLGFRFNRANGVFRANLSADRASGAQIGIDLDPVLPDEKRRAGQRIDAGLVIFAFVADVKRFVFG